MSGALHLTPVGESGKNPTDGFRETIRNLVVDLGEKHVLALKSFSATLES